MFSLRLRPLTFLDRLALCAVSIPLLLLYMNWARADGPPCEYTQKKEIACPQFGSATCDTYQTEADCKGKTNIELFNNYFTWGSSGTAKTMAVPETDGSGKAIQKDCSKEWNCLWDEKIGCVKNTQKGNTVTAAIYKTIDCPSK